MKILAVNTGSTSSKLDLYQVDEQGVQQVRSKHDTSAQVDPQKLLSAVIPDHSEIDAVVHRVVHGGLDLVDSCIIDADTEARIEQLSRLAPLHNPVALYWIQACRQYTNKPQVAVFDTAFFANLPAVASNYALPYQTAIEHGIRRYGFHGIAHLAMWQRWSALRPDLPHGGKLISIQLGGGCSITATLRGSPLDTSMGFSPAEGLIMATRSGDIDPGIIIQLIREEKMTPDSIEQLINEQSGLLGLSGKSADMRKLVDNADPQCRLAMESYCYRVRKYIGAYQAILGGVDGIVFGGGVGENMPQIRSHILTQMSWCGIQIDHEKNAEVTGSEARISTDDSRVDVRVLPVDEAPIMVKEAYHVLLS